MLTEEISFAPGHCCDPASFHDQGVPMALSQRLKETLHKLLASGKVWTAIVGAVAAMLAKRGLVIPPEAYDAIKDITMTLLAAQGAQDLGKAVAAAKAPPIVAGGDVNIEAPPNP